MLEGRARSRRELQWAGARRWRRSESKLKHAPMASSKHETQRLRDILRPFQGDLITPTQDLVTGSLLDGAFLRINKRQNLSMTQSRSRAQTRT
jgi:hypothetical protein